MNIQNVSALAAQLESLGFENAGYSLLKKICFRPVNFLISQRIEKGNDQIAFELFFKRTARQDGYVLMYYDAILQIPQAFTDSTINGVDIAGLEKQMTGIDWKKAFDFDEVKQFNADDKASWEKEQRIEAIMNSLSVLETTDDGKLISVSLKLKFWNGALYFEMFDNINPQRNKNEISQRFYLFEGQVGISVDEAYRFLLNRRLEKQMQAKRKQTGDALVEETENDSQASSGNGLLQKKRLSKPKGAKRNKAIQN